MDAFDLPPPQAARWLWESLWSPRRHARINILDVALFDEGVDTDDPGDRPATPTISRWLFTARDGRVMKKATSNTSLGALKQSLWERIFPGGARTAKLAIERHSTQKFADALLSSGEVAPLDEDAWTSLVVGGGGPRDLVAVTACGPGQYTEFRCGSRQQVTCEYKVKCVDTLALAGRATSRIVPHASVSTRVLVNPAILRESEADRGLRERGQEQTVGESSLHGRLISKIKAVNTEVEATMRRLVRWVQDVRGVQVLAMTALFTVLYSPETSAPRVWFERALHARAARTGSSTTHAAPVADAASITLPTLHHFRAKELHAAPSVDTTVARSNDAMTRHANKNGSSTPREGIVPVFVENVGARHQTHDTPPCEASSVNPTSSETQSTAAILCSAASAALSIGDRGKTAQSRNETGARHCAGRPGSTSSNFVASQEARDDTSSRLKCRGDFCTSKHNLDESTRHQSTSEIKKVDNDKLVPNWTNISLSGQDGALLAVTNPCPQPDGREVENILHPITFRSVALARDEAERGCNVSWGESLRKYWHETCRERSAPAVITPMAIYKEVVVCGTCYDVYQRLDKLREHATGSEPSHVLESERLPETAGTNKSCRRSKTGEEGIRCLSEEVTAVLNRADARTGEIGVKASVVRRSRLSKSRSCDDDVSLVREQALLVDRLARPKPHMHVVDSLNICSAGTEKKRRVKSQGDIPEHASDRGEQRAGPRALPSLRGRRRSVHTLQRQKRKGPNVEYGIAQGCEAPAHRFPKLASWYLHEDAGDGSKGTHKNSANVKAGYSEECCTTSSEANYRGTQASGANISAIEAMLKGGTDSYLPTRACDLPEATLAFDEDGCHQLYPCGVVDECARRVDCENRSKQVALKKLRNRDKSEPRTMMEPAHAQKSARARSGRGGMQERLLHPWQRVLEAKKRTPVRLAEHEASLAREKRRRKDARRAAAASEDCQRAWKRVVARRRRQRRRCHRLGSDAGRTKENEQRTATGAAVSVLQLDEDWAQDVDKEDRFEHVQDALRWARRTFESLLQRLREEGIDVGEANEPRQAEQTEITRLVDDIRICLAAFEEKIKSLGTGVRAPFNATSGSTHITIQSGAFAACDDFEDEIGRLIEKLAAAAKDCGRDGAGTGSGECGTRTEVGTVAHATRSRAPPESLERSCAKIMPAFGLCPSCSISPVSRQCLDCPSGAAGRYSCAGCFARFHADVGRLEHRFIKIRNRKRAGTDACGDGCRQDTAKNQEPRGSQPPRCCRCKMIDAARRCLDCDADMCAACHCLAHRSPTRQNHVTEFVGKAALATQDLSRLHAERSNYHAHLSLKARTLPVTNEPSSPAVSQSEGSHEPRLREGTSFEECFAQSLAQVRSTLHPPVVCPRGGPEAHEDSGDTPVDGQEAEKVSSSTEAPHARVPSIYQEGIGQGALEFGIEGDDANEVDEEAAENLLRGQGSGTHSTRRDNRRTATTGIGAAYIQGGGRGRSMHHALAQGGHDPGQRSGSDSDKRNCHSSDESSDDEGMMWSPHKVPDVATNAA